MWALKSSQWAGTTPVNITILSDGVSGQYLKEHVTLAV